MMSQESQHSPPPFHAPFIIRKKRDGEELTAEEIKWFIQEFMTGTIADYQMSALLMAIYKEGMNVSETAALTDAMLYSGSVLKFDCTGVVDKHSTGGVGDKSSFVLGPLAAAVGVKVPMMAGRGLGHTGGTVDKIEAVAGYKTDLTLAEFKQMVEVDGLSLIGQTQEIAPADKRIYALRDVTATVESIPLITASIMSKKLAEGAQGIVMDVKTGQGAFMKKKSDARALGKSLMRTASRFERKMMVFITDMNQPLGEMIGHSNELIECVETLKGKGPKDLTDLSIELAAGMMVLAGLAKSMTSAKKAVKEALASGVALEKFRKLISRHGGNPAFIDDYSLLPLADQVTIIKSQKVGQLKAIKTKELGQALLKLGGGRVKAGQTVDMKVGLQVHQKIGAKIREGDPLLSIFHHENQKSIVKEIVHSAEHAFFTINRSTTKNHSPLILETFSNL